MAIGPRLDLRQSQALVMTPQLQQAIRLLQMSSLEVSAFVEAEIEQNPLLDREDGEGGPETGAGEEAPAEPAEAYAEDAPEAPDTAELTGSETLVESDEVSIDADYENVWDTGSVSDGAGDHGLRWESPSGGEGDDPGLESVAAAEKTLRAHLLEQVNVDLADPAERLIGAHLVEMLDEAGYFAADLDEAAETLGCEEALVARVLERLRGFDPPGIFARNLADCLALQLTDRGRLDRPMRALLGHLELLAKRDFAALRRVCQVDSATLADMITEIKSLNPKPASAFDHDVAQLVVPDVFARMRPDGSWAVELNADALPRVLVNNRYYAVVAGKARNKAEKEYLIDRLQSANWLVKSLHQRAQTILKVATELVHQQEAFFTNGVAFLRPLTLRDVAEAVSVHESTVSRVTSNKYIGFSRGVYEMKYLFTSGVGGNGGGDSHSSESIRFRIKALIERESVDDVLSDDKIVDILRRDGIDVARRTVAKYRESLQIPSSVQRRREKALQA